MPKSDVQVFVLLDSRAQLGLKQILVDNEHCLESVRSLPVYKYLYYKIESSQ